MLCVICIMSAALLYYDFVIIPRQNRELVEDLKSHFPEEFPPGGALQHKKKNRLEENWKCLPLTFAPSRVSIRMFGAGLRSRRVASIIRYCRAARKNRSIICRGLPGKLRHQWKFVPPGRLYSGRIGNLTIYGHNMNSGAMFGNLDRYASYDYWKAHPRVFFQTPEGMEEYRIAAVLKADVSMFDFQQTSFHSPQELEAYAAQAKALSLFETGVAGAGL